jgi:hypothetical protein
LEVLGAVEEVVAAPDATSVENRVTFRATAQEQAAVVLEEVKAAGRGVSSAAKMGTCQGIVPKEETSVKRKFLLCTNSWTTYLSFFGS